MICRFHGDYNVTVTDVNAIYLVLNNNKHIRGCTGFKKVSRSNTAGSF